MPFTLSHTAAIIPIARKPLVFSALVVGSMSPDFPYFINLAPRGEFGHTIPGIFLFCLPAGMLLLWVFHRLMKFPLFSLLPLTLQVRLISHARDFNFWPIARHLWVITSLLIGIMTHVFWDGFTHEYGWAVSWLPILDRPVIELGSKSILLCNLLQHSGTFVGGCVILLCFIRWIDRAPREEVRDELRKPAAYKLFWAITMIIGAILVGSLSSWWKLTHASIPGGLSKMAGYFAVGVLSGLFVELVLFSIYWMSESHSLKFQNGESN
ncbi:MAG: DUF4184 family protein [Blastocatellia bacterium]|nr:DUF4184 family protein [Blastocatellia bacterium]